MDALLDNMRTWVEALTDADGIEVATITNVASFAEQCATLAKYLAEDAARYAVLAQRVAETVA